MTKYTFLKFWFLLGIAVTAMSGLVYLAVQQELRHSANNPQIQIAEDVARLLTSAKQPSDFNIADKVDIGKSLGIYLTIYDTTGKPISGTGQLDGNFPTLPEGVFQYTRTVGEDIITWQPRPEIRSALVVVSYTNGFVAVGRSLREVEIMESDTLKIALLVWFATILVTLAFALIFGRKEKTNQPTF